MIFKTSSTPNKMGPPAGFDPQALLAPLPWMASDVKSKLTGRPFCRCIPSSYLSHFVLEM